MSKNLTLKGTGATLDAQGGGTTLTISSGKVKVIGFSITGGTGTDFCAPSGCFQGGGIWNGGTLTIMRSTVSGNSASYYGGGIFDSSGTLSITNSTVSGNSAAQGGGIFDNGEPGSLAVSTLTTTIDAGNTGGDCFGGTISSNGYNLVGADCAFSSTGDQTVPDTASAIGINPLANNGGKTKTMALVSTSPAVDAIPVGALAADGITPLCPASGTTDQRGRPRPQGAGCDVGAYELKV